MKLCLVYLGALCFIFLIESFFWDEYDKYFNKRQQIGMYQHKESDLLFLPPVRVADVAIPQ